MNVVFWILQVLLGVYFVSFGVTHFLIPPNLPAPMSWIYDLPPFLHYFSGIAEILGGLGLVLPSLTKIRPRLTPLAGLGLTLVMLGAMVWHFPRGEYANIVQNLILGGLAAFVAYGRWRMQPIEPSASEPVSA